MWKILIFHYPFSISRSLMSFLLPFLCRSEDFETVSGNPQFGTSLLCSKRSHSDWQQSRWILGLFEGITTKVKSRSLEQKTTQKIPNRSNRINLDHFKYFFESRVVFPTTPKISKAFRRDHRRDPFSSIIYPLVNIPTGRGVVPEGQPLVLRGWAELATHWFHYPSLWWFPCHNISLS